jgi:hypothetical protein
VTVACVFAASALACRRAPVAVAARRIEAPIPTPARDTSPSCADVGAWRACWTGALVAELVPRTVPAGPAASPMGWRCAWPGAARLCVDRRADVPLFTCAGDRCTQAHARRPDDGEWTCVDTAGATLCLGGGRAAGVAPAPADPAWICGARRQPTWPSARTLGGAGDERICVDLSPDFPDGDATGWRCRAQNGAAAGRVCERGAAAGSLGQPCDRARPCVDGAVCAAGRCVPARPKPSCWLDDDCPGGACRFGTCFEGGAP